MLKNYIKTSIRAFIKNPVSSFINTIGLAAAIGCCMVVYAYLSTEFGMEKQHRKSDRVFMVTSEVNRDGDAELYGRSPAAIGLKLQEDFPQITHMTRIEDRSIIVKRDENVFREWTRMVDPDFLKMLNFELIKGTYSCLKDRNAVIITEKMATKYFGDEDPIGQTISARFSSGIKAQLTVGGILKIDDMKTTLGFPFLTNFELLEIVDEEYKAADWSKNIDGTFVMVDEASQINTITEQIKDYPAIINSAQADWKVLELTFEPLATLYHRSNDIRWDVSGESDKEGHIILSIIALLMLVLACLNYLNIAISSAVKRLKEIGIRKVIGANRSRLIMQFMIENVMLTAIAMVMGTIIGATLFLPGLNNLFDTNMTISIMSIEFYGFVVGLLLVTAIASGAYPALYISKFQVVSILKGKLLFGRRNILSKVFMTLQFIIACITVVCGIFFTLNTEYTEKRTTGYDKENTMMIRMPDIETLRAFENRLDQLPQVESLSAGNHHLGWGLASSVVDLPDRKLETRRMDVDERYITTMGLILKQGRDFKQDFESDKTVVIINETFAQNLEWEDPIRKTFRFDSVQYTVIGVLEDFNYFSFWSEIGPVFLRVGDEEESRVLAIKVTDGQLSKSYEEIETLWGSAFPELPFDGRYQEDFYEQYLKNINGHKVLLSAVAIIALVMTCLGLYGLVGLNVSGRIKEFSVRKVLGASALALTRAIGSHFAIYMGIALILGAPISWWVVNMFFDQIYTYHMEVTFPPVLFALFLILVTVFITISTHLWRVSKSNPAEGLRVE